MGSSNISLVFAKPTSRLLHISYLHYLPHQAIQATWGQTVFVGLRCGSAGLRSGGRPTKTPKAILRPSGFSHPATRPLVVYCSVRMSTAQPRVLMRRRPAAQRSWAPPEAGTSHGRRDLLPNARNYDARRQAIAALVGAYGGRYKRRRRACSPGIMMRAGMHSQRSQAPTEAGTSDGHRDPYANTRKHLRRPVVHP
jgi:hypothetical protein